MYNDLHTVNNSGNEISDDDDIVNNVDDLEHSEVDETPRLNVAGDEEDNGSETEKKDDESKKVEPKKRRVLNPQPKLNEERLKGPRGIGVIEKMFEDVRLKGKGHEKEDLDFVMGRLEHWAHRLFPKYQFDDCLKRIEKLGAKRPIVTYVKRLRMDEEDEIVNEVIEPPSPPSVDPFDELIGHQKEPSPQTVKTPVTLSAEQRERMLRNRILAEERRLARLQAQKERGTQANKNTDKEGNSESNLNASEYEQIDASENIRKQLNEVPLETSDLHPTVPSGSEASVPLTDRVDTEVIGSDNQEMQISHSTDRPIGQEETLGDKIIVINDGVTEAIVISETIISDHDNKSTEFTEMNSIAAVVEQDLVENG